MIASGNYFMPTINGEVYFDKPLLSYWTIIPFAKLWGMSEAAARLPSTCAGVGAVLLLFSMGRRLFGIRAGLAAAGLLLTSTMFVLWTRTASAELLNLLSIWLMLWAFMAGGVSGRLKHLMLLYCIGAVSAFLKGPVAPAVAFSAIGFYSLVRFVTAARTGRFTREKAQTAFFLHFNWIASLRGGLAVLAAAALFAFLFLLPVLVTGSWDSAELMWRENVERFFKPFDHVEPPYVYVKYIPLFFLPWTLLLVAALWRSKEWTPNWQVRWMWLTAFAIFVFFTASGSRRSYYILPLVPALALITGKSISDWLTGTAPKEDIVFKSAALATSAFPVLAGIALIVAYFTSDLPHHAVQVAVAILAVTGGGAALALFLKNKKINGAVLLFIIVYSLHIWGFTGGMASMEQMRTFRPFCREAAAGLQGIEDGKIALYPGGDSSLIFYLNRGPLKTLKNPEEIRQFFTQHPDGVVVSELHHGEMLKNIPGLEGVRAFLVQEKGAREKKNERLVLLRLGHG